MNPLIELTAIRSSSDLFQVLSDGTAFLLVGLLLFILVEKVLLDARGLSPTVRKMRAFDITIWPLAFALAMIVLLRIVQILQ